jgi:glycosyltransferase involved in cell wall biosynthesis
MIVMPNEMLPLPHVPGTELPKTLFPHRKSLFVGPAEDRAAAAVRRAANGHLMYWGQLPAPWQQVPADILLHTARYEALGRVILEAMSGAVPVVSTRVGGIPYAVAHGEAGFLCDLGDIAGLTESLVALASDPGLRTGSALVAAKCRSRCDGGPDGEDVSGRPRRG